MERPFATDPEDTIRPHYRARYVSLTGEDRPDDVAAPTQMFAKVEIPEEQVEVRERTAVKDAVKETPDTGWQGAGGYLTEVEKVQLRRRERVAGEVGRHRK